jgi:PAS domain S-box-containing protein
VTVLRQREAELAEQERQFREILEHCPAGLNVVDEDGRLLFDNARARDLLGYDEAEMHLIDTKKFWNDLDHRARIIATLGERGGQVLNEEVIWRTKQGTLLHDLISYPQAAYKGGGTSASSAESALPGRMTLPRSGVPRTPAASASSASSKRSRASRKASSSTTQRIG